MPVLPRILRSDRSSAGTVKTIRETLKNEKHGLTTLPVDVSAEGQAAIISAANTYLDGERKSLKGDPAKRWNDLHKTGTLLSLSVPSGGSILVQDRTRVYCNDILKGIKKPGATPSALLEPVPQPIDESSGPLGASINSTPIIVGPTAADSRHAAQSFADQAASENASRRS